MSLLFAGGESSLPQAGTNRGSRWRWKISALGHPGRHPAVKASLASRNCIIGENGPLRPLVFCKVHARGGFRPVRNALVKSPPRR